MAYPTTLHYFLFAAWLALLIAQAFFAHRINPISQPTFSRLFHVCFGILTVGMLAIACIALGYPSSDEPYPLGGAIIRNLGPLIFAVLWIITITVILGAGAGARNRRTLQLFQDIVAGKKTVPFVLYLRPFQADREIGSSLMRLDGFERGLVSAVENRGVGILCLGRYGEGEIGRLRVADEDWQSAIQQLADNASAIIVWPSARPGTSWEISMLRQRGHLRRTIALAPPLSKLKSLNRIQSSKKGRQRTVLDTPNVEANADPAADVKLGLAALIAPMSVPRYEERRGAVIRPLGSAPPVAHRVSRLSAMIENVVSETAVKDDSE